jgi:hypothetical protein
LPPAHSIAVSTVMFGESFLDAAGNIQTASTDGVLLSLIGGAQEVMATRFQSAESAVELALAIQSAAVTAFKQSVDDDGKQASMSQRLSRLSAAYSRAGR